MKKPLLWVLVLVMSVSLIMVFSLGGCRRVEEPVVEEVEEFVLDLFNTITQLDILNFHNKNLHGSFLHENNELSLTLEYFKEIQRLSSETNPDIDKLAWLMDAFATRQGEIWNGESWEIIDQERHDRFVEFMALEVLYFNVNSNT